TTVIFCLYCYLYICYLHSFPTRRSSDLCFPLHIIVIIFCLDRAFKICPVITMFGLSMITCPISFNGILVIESLLTTRWFNLKYNLQSLVKIIVLQLIWTTIHVCMI